MRTPITPLSIAWRVLACLAIAHSSTRAATFDVTTTVDSGSGSLRQAIDDANKSPGPDVINFSIPGSGEQQIRLASELPAITETVTIDGYSQPGANRNTLSNGFDAVINIFIDGAAVPASSKPALWARYGITFRKGAEGSRLSGVKLSNFSYGVALANVDSVTVEGNKVLDNRDAQILVTGNGNAIGMPGAGMRNLIAGGAPGIVIAGDGNMVKNNYIGFAESINHGVSVNAASNGVVAYFGLIAVAYRSPVVSGPDLEQCDEEFCALAFHSNHHQIGGLEGGEGNVIIGQGLAGVITRGGSSGVRTNAVMRVEGNRFGASFDGTRKPGFENFYGVFLNHSGASINIIQANSIYDGVAGIVVDGSGGKGNPPITGAQLTQNRIVGQSRMAIDLGDNNRDVNDKLDPDDGNNNTQNYPVLSGSSPGGGGWRLQSAASQTYTLEFFQSGGACKIPEADVYLGAYPVTTDAAGDATFSGPLGMLPGGFITATATDKAGNTSELSDCVAAAKLPSKIEIVSWNTPLLSGTQNSRYEMRVDGGGIFTPTGYVDLWSRYPLGPRPGMFGGAPLIGNTALWDHGNSGYVPGTFRVQAGYRGNSTFDPSTSNIVDVVVYDIKHTFKSGTSDILRAPVGNPPLPGSYEILAGSDIAAGVTGNWTTLALASGKRIVAAGKFIYGWGRSSFLVSDSSGNMSVEYFESGVPKSLPITGWLPGSVVGIGRFFGFHQQGIVIATGPKRFEARLLPGKFLSPLPVMQTDVLRDETVNPLITSLSIAAVGDFNGDGHDDIIWNADGRLEMWLMNGSTQLTSAIPIFPPITLAGGAPVVFTIAVVGDFDGDGRVDILWRGADYYYVALMDGGSLKEALAAIPVTNVPAEWKIKAVADYDGDGKADLLWRNEGSAPGANVIYYMNGSSHPRSSKIVPLQAFLPLTIDFIDP